MRYGFTTGSCAAAAAKAACYMLLTGKRKHDITIITPKKIEFKASITDINISEKCVSCSVIKDGGDDPDVTTGAHITASVTYLDEKSGHKCYNKKNGFPQVIIDGGDGVGRVTKPGLDQPVGNAAINHVPRQMIEEEVKKVMKLCDCTDDLYVEISVAEGRELAEKTFNPRLGIVGGISILGTSGIVEPMSSKALLDTIMVELKQKKALGFDIAAVSPGNYGLDFMKAHYGYDLDKSVKCSNFIGDTIDMAKQLGFSSMLLTGHVGKLIKVSGGIMNTHSKEADCRMELLSAAALRALYKTALNQNIHHGNADLMECEKQFKAVSQVLEAVTTEEGIRILREAGMQEITMDEVINKIMFYLRKRAGDNLRIECIMYSNDFGLLAQSAGAKELLERLL